MIVQNNEDPKSAIKNIAQKPTTNLPDLCHLSCDDGDIDHRIVDQRNRYYTGKYMTARDFQDEQDYFLGHHRLHNRLLHGWGIVCGLTVSPHPNPTCQDRYVVVSPGIAIDCCGREMVLKEKTVVQIWEPETVSADMLEKAKQAAHNKHAGDIDHRSEEAWEDRAEDEHDRKESGDAGIEHLKDHRNEKAEANPSQSHKAPELQHEALTKITGGPFLLVLKYAEEGIEWTPALYAEGVCDPRQLEANRVRELACLEVHRWDQHRFAGCWPIPEADRPEERIPCRNDCDTDSDDKGVPGCISADCQCKYGVPLALVTPIYKLNVKEWEITRHGIGWEGRRELRTPPEILTHIVDYNWTHGGVVKLSQLNNPHHMDGKLKIYFDRRLYDNPSDKGRGINEHTFVVTYHRQADVAYPLQVLYNDENPPYLEDEEGADADHPTCAAVFPIDDEMLRGDINIGDCILYVTLKCDFILDCHHRPVDGDHLAGKTPTGDGTAGGVFESWFRVVDDEREIRQKEKEELREARRKEERQLRERPEVREAQQSRKQPVRGERE